MDTLRAMWNDGAVFGCCLLPLMVTAAVIVLALAIAEVGAIIQWFRPLTRRTKNKRRKPNAK